MAYASVADMLARFDERELVNLTDQNDLGEVDSARVATALVDASAQVDSELRGGGYTTPLTSVPAEVVRATCVLARLYLYRTGGVPEHVQESADGVTAWLKRIAKGEAKLASTVSADESPSKIAAGSRTMAYDSDWESEYAQ